MRCYPVSAADAPEETPEALRNLWASAFNSTYASKTTDFCKTSDAKEHVAFLHANAVVDFAKSHPAYSRDDV
jgi:hypothetical protein